MPNSCDMIPFQSKQTTVRKHTYLFRGEWHATAKLFRVTAKDEDEAVVKAAKKEGKGCIKLSLIREIP